VTNMINKLIGHYRITEMIGRGGMGEIYLAEDTKLHRQVALKFLPKAMTADPEARVRFEREAQAAAALNHPNIITIYEIGEHEGQVFIAMEYAEGQTLKEIIDAGARRAVPLPITQVIAIAAQIASGLAAAHAKYIVHRDIKPQNILADKEGRVKILDFGLAKLKGVSSLTKESSTLGTVHYMSPEQTMGKDVDQRTDIWSLGVVLYEMLTGQLPFKGDYEQAVIYSILNEEPKPSDNLRPDIPAELKAIIDKCLEKETDVRYQHADDLHVDLKRVRGDTKPETSATGRRQLVEAHIKRTWLIAGSFILILALAGYFLFRGKGKPAAVARTSGQPCVAVVYFENNSGDKNMDRWRGQFAELLITDLSQSRLIDVVSSDQIFSVLKKLELLDAPKYSSEDLQRVADLSGSDYVVRGSYITAGKNLLINVALAEIKTGKTLSAMRLESRGEEEIFSKVDEITRKIKLDLDFTPKELAADPDRELETITTRSPQAFAYYSEGQKQNTMGNYRQTIKFMEKAVALDPDFAMAWRAMSVNYKNMGYNTERIRYMEKAMKHLDRVSERERLLITGLYYDLWEKTWPRAIESYQQLLRLYPNDYLATLWLGIKFRILEDWNKAEQLFKKNTLLRDEDISCDAIQNLCYQYILMGQYEIALQDLAAYQARFPQKRNSAMFQTIAQINENMGAYDKALTAIDQALAISADNFQTIVIKGYIYLSRGELVQAETWYRKLLASEEPAGHGEGLVGLYYFYMSQGQLAEGLKIIPELLDAAAQNQQKVWEYAILQWQAHTDQRLGQYAQAQIIFDKVLDGVLEKDDWSWLRTIYYDKGVAYAEAGQFAEAEKMAAKLKIYIDKGLNKKLQRLHDHLLGLIALKRGDAATAITLISRAISLLPGGDKQSFRDTLGDACFRADRFDEARQAYEQITLSPTGRLNFEYGPCLLKLGNTYQKLKDKGSAIRNYSQFIGYWKDCDPHFKPLLAEAKAEMQKLQGRL
jgi:serine/threonine protein kinase/Flp pilus assembly protein TadD